MSNVLLTLKSAFEKESFGKTDFLNQMSQRLQMKASWFIRPISRLCWRKLIYIANDSIYFLKHLIIIDPTHTLRFRETGPEINLAYIIERKKLFIKEVRIILNVKFEETTVGSHYNVTEETIDKFFSLDEKDLSPWILYIVCCAVISAQEWVTNGKYYAKVRHGGLFLLGTKSDNFSITH